LVVKFEILRILKILKTQTRSW